MSIKDKIKTAVMGNADMNAENALKVLRSDELRLFSDYFMFDERDMKMEADLTPGGKVTVVIKLEADGFKEAGRILD
ncbi:MAG: hypothetical protein HFK09_03615 [Clostridia bacterium]|nr:hypothetical protein [Clostridia bacterium]